MEELHFTYDVFFSHSGADKADVRELAERLKRDGVNVWFDEWVIQPGDSIPLAIERGLEASRTLVLVMSKNAFASDWVTLEHHTAIFRDPTNRKRRFVPLRLDDAEINDVLKQFAYVDWRHKHEKEYAKLLSHCVAGSGTGESRVDASSADATFALSTVVKFAEEAKQINSAAAVHDAIKCSLQALERFGYAGAMISLIMEDAGRQWIVSELAFGRVWSADAAHRTRREFERGDILAYVVKTRDSVFVNDCTVDTRCDLIAVKENSLTSFYAMPLFGPTNEVAGVLQVDLGDMRDEPLIYEQQSILDALGVMTGAAISRAILAEELSLVESFEKEFSEVQMIPEPALALERCIGHIHKTFATAAAHMYLFDERSETLRMYFGFGHAIESEVLLPLSAQRPSAHAFRENFNVVWNDVDAFHHYDGGLGDVVPSIVECMSHCTLLLKENSNAIGTLHLESTQPWAFSPWRMRTLQHVGRRIEWFVSKARKLLIAESICCEVFFAYARGDERFRDGLERHLECLKSQGVVATWHDRRISPGKEWKSEISHHIETADIIILMVSPKFIASEYCRDVEVKRAMERHQKGEARVVPVIVKPVDWHGMPFSGLQALPIDGKPLVQWRNRDEGYVNVALGIAAVAKEIARERHRASDAS